jgi:hypothetical protein
MVLFSPFCSQVSIVVDVIEALKERIHENLEADA